MEIKSLVHDLLNSLTIIDSNLSLALKENDLEKIKVRVKKAILANKKAVEVCKSKLGTGDKVLVGVKDFYLLSLKIFQDLYTKIEIKVEGNCDEKYQVARVHFFRVNENIIKNAIEANATTLVIIMSEDNIRFIDNGTGITSDSVTAIAQNGTSKNFGHGIGLGSIVSFCSIHKFNLRFGNNQEKDIFSKGFHIDLFFNK